MENGFGTTDILTGRGLGLAGFGGYNYGGQYADVSSNAVRINRNEGVTRDAASCVTGVLGASLDRISAQNFEGRFNAAITSLRDGQFQGELRLSDSLAAIRLDAAHQAAAAAQCCCELKIEMLKCCCETQKLVSAEGTATRELINQNTIRAAVDQNNINATVGAINANANANANAIVQAINSQCSKS